VGIDGSVIPELICASVVLLVSEMALIPTARVELQIHVPSARQIVARASRRHGRPGWADNAVPDGDTAHVPASISQELKTTRPAIHRHGVLRRVWAQARWWT